MMIRKILILFCSVGIPLLGVAGDLGERNRNIANVYFTVMFNFRNLDLLDQIMAEDYEHTDANGETTAGREAHKQVIAELLKEFPFSRAKIVETITTDEKVMTVVNFTADANGVSIVLFRELFIWRMENGKIVEGRTALGVTQVAGL
jgi:predicted SnoaL-like aldol condensation-catalyzing enzyme